MPYIGLKDGVLHCIFTDAESFEDAWEAASITGDTDYIAYLDFDELEDISVHSTT